MFLLNVYRYNKKLFLALLIFTIVQLLIFYKHGMTLTPWLNYGMFSGKVCIEKEYEAYGLKGKHPSFIHLISPQRDTRIIYPLILYNYQSSNNNFVEKTIQPISKKFGLNLNPRPYHVSLSEEDFKTWYYKFAANWVCLPEKEKYQLKPYKAAWKEGKLHLVAIEKYD